MTSPSVQSNFADAGGVSPGTCAFTGPQTAGNTNVICLRGDPFSGTPATTDITSVIDSSGNVYTKQEFSTFPAGGVPAVWIYTCVGIASHAAGNVVTVAFTGTFFLQIIIIEYPPTGAVSTSNHNNSAFGGPNVPIAANLTGTITGALVVMCSWAENVSVASAGSVGANAANVVYYDNVGGHNWVAQDGLGDGSSPMSCVCGGIPDNLFSMVVVAFTPTVISVSIPAVGLHYVTA